MLESLVGDSPSGKAVGSGPTIRGFESLIPSQEKRPTKFGRFSWLLRAKRGVSLSVPYLSPPITIDFLANLCYN